MFSYINERKALISEFIADYLQQKSKELSAVNAWGKDVSDRVNSFTKDGKMTSKNMRDEYGNIPFKMSEKHPVVADFERIIPEDCKSLNKKRQ